MKTYKRTEKKHASMYLVWIGGEFTAHRSLAVAERVAIAAEYRYGAAVVSLVSPAPQA